MLDLAGASGEDGVEEVALPLLAERRAGIVREARGSRVPRRDRWSEEGRLTREASLEQALVHPDLVRVVVRITVLAELPVDAPAAVHPIDYVEQPLRLARVVAVVVGADQVAVLVERELVRVAKTVGEYLQLGAVRIGAQDHAAVRVDELATFTRGDVDAEVALLEVDASVGTDDRSGMPVASEADVHAGTVGERLLRCRTGHRRWCRVRARDRAPA